MSELRHDPVTGVSTIIEPERAGRPRDFLRTSDEAQPASTCPFCAGHEAMTPPSRLELALPGQLGWAVRVFENKYPALVAPPEQEFPAEIEAPQPYTGAGGFGVHEVIVETPVHDQGLAELAPDHATLVADAYADRIRTWREDGRFAAPLIFRNFGRAAGASLYHPHSQFVALPRVPEAIIRELGNFSQEAGETRSCILCKALAADDEGGRIVFDDGLTVVHSPWAAPVPYFMRIAPRTCAETLAASTSVQRASLGRALVAAAGAISGLFGDAAFNLVVHDSPYSAQHAGLPYHWHVEIVPRVSEQAGFEWGSGVYLNVVDPDDAAARLRDGLDEHDRLRDGLDGRGHLAAPDGRPMG